MTPDEHNALAPAPSPPSPPPATPPAPPTSVPPGPPGGRWWRRVISALGGLAFLVAAFLIGTTFNLAHTLTGSWSIFLRVTLIGVVVAFVVLLALLIVHHRIKRRVREDSGEFVARLRALTVALASDRAAETESPPPDTRVLVQRAFDVGPRALAVWLTGRAYWRLFLAVGSIIGGAVLVSQFLVLVQQTERLTEQNGLIRLEARLAAIARQADLDQQAAERAYDEITRVLDESTSPSAQIYALERLPEAMVMPVTMVDPSWKPKPDDIDPVLKTVYPNLQTLAQRLLLFARTDRVPEGMEWTDEQVGSVSTAICGALHRLGVGNEEPAYWSSKKTDRELTTTSSMWSVLCIWQVVFDKDGYLRDNPDTALTELLKLEEKQNARAFLVPPHRKQQDPQSVEKSGWQGIDLRHLCGDQLAGAQLQGADLYAAQLRGTNLSHTQLQGANLQHARLQNAFLAGAQLHGVNLDGTLMQGAYLPGAQLQNAKLTKAQMQGASLYQAQMQGANLHKAQMRFAKLFDTQLQNANLSEAQMQRVGLAEAQMQGADLTGAQMQGANLSMTQMQGANLTGAQMQDVDLSMTQMQGVQLTEAQMQGTHLHWAQMQGANLTGAQMQGTHLHWAQMQGANLTGAQMQGANLTGAQMQGANLYETQIQGANLAGTSFGGTLATFGVQTISADLAWVCIPDQSFKDRIQLSIPPAVMTRVALAGGIQLPTYAPYGSSDDTLYSWIRSALEEGTIDRIWWRDRAEAEQYLNEHCGETADDLIALLYEPKPVLENAEYAGVLIDAETLASLTAEAPILPPEMTLSGINTSPEAIAERQDHPYILPSGSELLELLKEQQDAETTDD